MYDGSNAWILNIYVFQKRQRIWTLNSLPIGELGNRCLKGWMGAWTPQAKEEGIHGNPASGNHPCMQPPTDTVTLKEFSGKYSPDLMLTNAKKGRDGLGARIRNDSLSNRSANISSKMPAWDVTYKSQDKQKAPEVTPQITYHVRLRRRPLTALAFNG